MSLLKTSSVSSLPCQLISISSLLPVRSGFMLVAISNHSLSKPIAFQNSRTSSAPAVWVVNSTWSFRKPFKNHANNVKLFLSYSTAINKSFKLSDGFGIVFKTPHLKPFCASWLQQPMQNTKSMQVSLDSCSLAGELCALGSAPACFAWYRPCLCIIFEPQALSIALSAT